MRSTLPSADGRNIPGTLRYTRGQGSLSMSWQVNRQAMNKPKKNYEVGYGKPPHDGQFKSGISGNPQGRPKGSKSIATMFNEITRELINVKENGTTKTVTRMEAVLRQMLNLALSGDARAMREIVQLQRIFEVAESQDESLHVPHEREASVFQSVLKRVRQLAGELPTDGSGVKNAASSSMEEA